MFERVKNIGGDGENTGYHQFTAQDKRGQWQISFKPYVVGTQNCLGDIFNEQPQHRV